MKLQGFFDLILHLLLRLEKERVQKRLLIYQEILDKKSSPIGEDAQQRGEVSGLINP
jgi:hypothetical protein